MSPAVRANDDSKGFLINGITQLPFCTSKFSRNFCTSAMQLGKNALGLRNWLFRQRIAHNRTTNPPTNAVIHGITQLLTYKFEFVPSFQPPHMQGGRSPGQEQRSLLVPYPPCRGQISRSLIEDEDRFINKRLSESEDVCSIFPLFVYILFLK